MAYLPKDINEKLHVSVQSTLEACDMYSFLKPQQKVPFKEENEDDQNAFDFVSYYFGRIWAHLLYTVVESVYKMLKEQ